MLYSETTEANMVEFLGRSNLIFLCLCVCCPLSFLKYIFLFYLFSITIRPSISSSTSSHTPSPIITTPLSLSMSPSSFIFFAHSLHTPNFPLQSCQPISLLLFCLLVYFVHWIPHMSEIIW